MEYGETLINCLAYVDLHAVRAGIVERQDEYPGMNLAGMPRGGTGIDCFPWILVFNIINGLIFSDRLARLRNLQHLAYYHVRIH